MKRWKSPHDGMLYVTTRRGRILDVVDGPYPDDREGRAEVDRKVRLHVELAAERRLEAARG